MKGVEAKARASIVKACSVDCPECYPASDCSSGEPFVTNTENLVVAKKSLAHSQQVIATRLRDLYVRGEGDSTLEVLLGSTSLEDVVNRLDAIERVSHQDSRILSDVKKYKKEVLDNRSRLEDAHAKQADVVQQRAQDKRSIEGQISEQNQLLATIKDQIAQLKVEEQQRQAALAAQARARAAAERAAAEQAQQVEHAGTIVLRHEIS